MLSKKYIFIVIFSLLCSQVKQAYADYKNQPITESLRIISLAPSTTEILFALGLEKEIIGISSLCNYPQQTKHKEKIGTFSCPDIEKIIFLKPDLIFCTGLKQSVIAQKLKELKLSVYINAPANIKELFESIREIGSLTNKQKNAEILIQKMQNDIETVNSSIKNIPEESRPKVFVEIWNKPLMAAGKNSFINELITLAGGINIAYDTKKTYSSFNAETVIERKPDCIIIGYMQKETPIKLIAGRFGWENIPAVRNNRIYNDINTDLFLRPGPRLTEGLKQIHARLYPKKPPKEKNE
ncbi:MAG: cobalamin-binding protein [Candidatus Omnitrophota bacterium]